ncbi:MAG: GNAT family N-acetyltransferase [Candidatus Bathyarchaeia archaeon]
MTTNAREHEIEIRRLGGRADAEICARMMANSEPWITLRRDCDASLKVLTDPSREVYLAMVRNEIVGFTILTMHGAFVGYLQSVCVAPQWRGKGFGSKLMDYVEKRILSETPNVFICVSSFNGRVQRLYERRGYEVVGELKNWIVPGHSEILLRKTIAPLTEFKRQ